MPDAAFTMAALPRLREWIAELPSAYVEKEALLRVCTPQALNKRRDLSGFVFRSAALSIFLQQLNQRKDA
jgi:hypothetical protein